MSSILGSGAWREKAGRNRELFFFILFCFEGLVVFSVS